MMHITAQHADIWNTMSFDVDFAVQLDEVSARADAMDDICRDVGRDPGTLRRSANLFDAQARAQGGRLRYLDDADLFASIVRQLSDVGYTDIGLYFPNDPSQLDAFEHIGRDVLPELRLSLG